MEPATTQCDVCKRFPSSNLPFLCTMCAQGALYQPRFEVAQSLLENEALQQEIERKVSSPNTVAAKNSLKTGAQLQEPSQGWAIGCVAAEQLLLEDRTRETLSHVEALRREVNYRKAEITKRKAEIVKRRADLESAKYELLQRETGSVGPIERGIQRMEHRWDAMHNRMVESRVFLCREAAQLHGLQQRKRKRGGSTKDIYVIGGMPIVDLRDLNNASPAQVTSATTSLAHLVHLVSHYLSLRLPAEITLPHRDYPLPTIFSPGSSYTARDVPFPGSTPSQSSNNSPSASRTADTRSPPRPRPLHLDKKLSILAKEDQVAYALFVEGMTLLAWDIAWIGKTQGLNIGAASWEEVCALGKNLWQLLVAPLPTHPHRPPLSSNPSSKDLPSSRPPLARNATTTTTHTFPAINEGPHNPPPATPQPTLGHFSHGTAHSFLGAATGVEHMRGWRLQSPVKVIEKVKAFLLSERTGAEWEILEGGEWEDEPSTLAAATLDGNGIDGGVRKTDDDVRKGNQEEEEAVLVKGHSKDGGVDEGSGVPSGADAVGEEAKGKGASWMKVKSRGGP